MTTKNDFLTQKVITYLGNKRKLLNFINEQVTAVVKKDAELKEKPRSEVVVFDIFSGSGVVSRSLKHAGYNVLSNDLELYSIAINKAFIGTNAADLERLFAGIPERLFDYYQFNKVDLTSKKVNRIAGFEEVEDLILNHIETKESLMKLIKEKGSYKATLNLLNLVRTLKNKNIKQAVKDSNIISKELTEVEKKKRFYFQSTYAPKDTLNYSFENERLFFTQENAQFLDAVLDALFFFEDEQGKIFGEYDLGDLDSLQIGDEERNKIATPNKFNKEVSPIDVIIAEVFYLMTWNINTSGTMKGYHNGWGGKGANALKRILAHMQLTGLPLIDESEEGTQVVRGENYNDFAELLFKEGRNGLHDKKVDVIYADPPYNQHQYSANYHMLTTAIRNRDYDAGEVIQGSRAGIRSTHTRSDFSKSRLEDVEGFDKKVSFAYVAFDEFVKNVQNHTKYLLVSYNQEGVLSQSELIDVMSQLGNNKVDFVVQKHEKYKGGKNTNTSNYVVEYLFVVTMNENQTVDKVEEVKIRLQNETRKQLVLDKCMRPEMFEHKEFTNDGGYKVWLDKEMDSFLILNKDLKVVEDKLALHTDEVLAQIEEKMFADIDPVSLMNRYLCLDPDCHFYEAKLNIEAALKLLPKFKIVKHKQLREYYFSLIPVLIENMTLDLFDDVEEENIEKEKEKLLTKFEKIKSKM